MNSVYNKITELVIAKLEQGVIPWRKPWIDAGTPRNLISKRNYRGINLLLLSCMDYEKPYFLSFNQLKKLDGSVRKGEKGNLVVFCKWTEVKDESGAPVIEGESGEAKRIPILRHYYVFNVAQCEGIAPKYIPELPKREFQPIRQAEQIVSGMPQRPQITYKGDRAYYSPGADIVNLPVPGSFSSDEEIYSTLFHELVHSTGHQSRLDRGGVSNHVSFGSEQYSREELIAEMGAAFLCAEAGIENKIIDNSASYIANWLAKLRNDKRMVAIAAGAAQKACDFILGKKSGGSGDERVG
jgi:antirestriction protein ArdC